jgi:tetratricopeptide (TPR) repeat protein
VIRAYEGWGNPLANTGRAPQAEEVAREVVEMKEQVYGADHPTVARTLHTLGSAIQFQGRYAEAIEVFEEALRRFEASVGLEHSAAAAVYGNLARFHRLLGDPERAIELIERGVELYEAIYGPESYRMRQHLSILGNSYAEAGRLREAMAIYDRIEAINVAHDVYDRTNCSNKALTWRDLGDEESMMAEYAAAVAKARENFPDDPLVAVQALISMGLAHGELGEWDAAADTLRTVYEIRRAELPQESWYVWNSLSLYYYALLGTDRIDEAGPALLKAYEGLVAAPRDRSAHVIDLRIRETVERLTRFYEETGNAEELARWREVLRELDGG